jgi:hypothetical protein
MYVSLKPIAQDSVVVLRKYESIATECLCYLKCIWICIDVYVCIIETNRTRFRGSITKVWKYCKERKEVCEEWNFFLDLEIFWKIFFSENIFLRHSFFSCKKEKLRRFFRTILGNPSVGYPWIQQHKIL